jgi:hypothetical protein
MTLNELGFLVVTNESKFKIRGSNQNGRGTIVTGTHCGDSVCSGRYSWRAGFVYLSGHSLGERSQAIKGETLVRFDFGLRILSGEPQKAPYKLLQSGGIL